MVSPNSSSIIEASQDSDLITRACTLAFLMGVSNPDASVATKIRSVVTAQLDGDTCLATVYEYAQSEREKALANVPDLPGKDMSIVTDDLIRSAISVLIDSGDLVVDSVS